MSIHVTYQQILDGLQKAVDDRGPDYIYQNPNRDGSCSYVHDTQPGCIVGYVLADLGVPLHKLEMFDYSASTEGNPHRPATISTVVIADLAKEKVLTFDSPEEQKKISRKLRAVQQQQDRSRTWGEAILYENPEGIDA